MELINIQVYSCVKVHTMPLILCLLYVQNPNDLDKPVQMQERDLSFLPLPYLNMGAFLQESEGKEEGFGLYFSPLSKKSFSLMKQQIL